MTNIVPNNRDVFLRHPVTDNYRYIGFSDTLVQVGTPSTQYLYSIYTLSKQCLHNIYTLSTPWYRWGDHLHIIYTVSTQYLHNIYTRVG